MDTYNNSSKEIVRENIAVEQQNQANDFANLNRQSLDNAQLSEQHNSINVNIAKNFDGFSFYSNRNESLNNQTNLIDSKWNDGDSTSMQNVKGDLSLLRDFHTMPILSVEEMQMMRSFLDDKAAFQFACKKIEYSITKIISLTNNLVYNCEIYEKKHKPITKKGKKRLRMVSELKNNATIELDKFTRAAKSVISAKSKEKVFVEQMKKGCSFEELFEALKLQTLHSDAKEYVKNELEELPTINDVENPMRTDCTYKVAQTLGVASIFAETHVKLDAEKNKCEVTQELVTGENLRNLFERKIPVYFNAEAKRQMSSLAVFDMLSGYYYRSSKEIFADYSVKRLEDKTSYIEIRGIKVLNNDKAFGPVYGPEDIEGEKQVFSSLKNLQYIDKDFYDKIMALSADSVAQSLNGSLFSSSCRENMEKRLEYVKKTLRKKHDDLGEKLYTLPEHASDIFTSSINSSNFKTIEDALNDTNKASENKIGTAIIDKENIKEIENTFSGNKVLSANGENDEIDIDYAFEEELENEVNLDMNFGLIEEIENEDKIKEFPIPADFMAHIPGGEVLKEKYHIKSKNLQFEGMSYYNRRKLLTEKELQLKENIINLGQSDSLKEINDALAKVHEFHKLPVFSEEQLAQIKAMPKDKKRIDFIKEALNGALANYNSLVTDFGKTLEEYVKNHEAMTPKGKNWLAELETIRVLLIDDLTNIKDEIEVIGHNFIDEENEIENILAGGNWVELLSTSRSIKGADIIHFNLGNGRSNTTSKYEYNGKKYFRKDESNGIGGNTNNNIAARRFAGMFNEEGLYVPAMRVREYDNTKKSEENASYAEKSAEKYGIIMEVSKGVPLRSLKNQNIAFSSFAKTQLSKLVILDYVMGQTDRNSSNLFVDVEKRRYSAEEEIYVVKSIQGIDNDQSFQTTGPVDMKTGFGYSLDIEKLEYVDKKFFDKIVKMDFSLTKEKAAYLMSDCNISDETFDIIEKRLRHVADVLMEKYERKGDQFFNVPLSVSGVITPHMNAFNTKEFENKYGPGYDLDAMFSMSHLPNLTAYFKYESKEELDLERANSFEVDEYDNNGYIKDENKLIDGDDSSDMMASLPQGGLLHEKYNKKSDTLIFSGQSYYEKRKLLTKLETNITTNFSRGRLSKSEKLISDALKKVKEFHKNPIFSEKQLIKLKSEPSQKEKAVFVKNELAAAKNNYCKLVDELIINVEKYIDNHFSMTEKGQRWMKTMSSFLDEIKSDKNNLSNEIDNITYNIGEEIDQFLNNEKGGSWLDLLSVSRSIDGAKIINFSADNGISGTTSKYVYKGKNYFRKKDVKGEAGDTINNVAIRRFAGIFNEEDIYVPAYRVREYNVTKTDESNLNNIEKSKEEYGVILEVAKGMMLKDIKQKGFELAGAGAKQPNVVYSANVKKQFSKMIVLDYITGQVDRKGDNLFVDAELRIQKDGSKFYYVKSLQAIDSDMSFDYTSVLNMENGFSYSTKIGELEYIDEDFYKKLLSMNAQKLKDELSYILLDCDFSEDIFNVIEQRFNKVKDVLKEKHKQKGDKFFDLPDKATDIMHPHLNSYTKINTDEKINKHNKRIKELKEKGKSINDVADKSALISGVDTEVELNDENRLKYSVCKNFLYNIAEEIEVKPEIEEEIEIGNEERFNFLKSNSKFMAHIPGGALLKEKYHVKSDTLMFPGLSYYQQRSQLTEKELLIKANISNVGDSKGIEYLGNAIDKLHLFHKSSVLSKEVLDEIKAMPRDNNMVKFATNAILQAAGKYVDLVNDSLKTIQKYVSTHVPKTQNGRNWIKYLIGIVDMLNKDKEAFLDETNTFCDSVMEEEDVFNSIIDGGDWTEILSISRSIKGGISSSAGGGSTATTVKYEYNGKAYYKKTDSNDSANNMIFETINNVSVRRFADFFGAKDLFVPAYRVRNLDASDNDEVKKKFPMINNKYSVMLEEVKGATLQTIFNEYFGNCVFSEDVKNQISRLAVVDCITGQSDRKFDNIMARYEIKEDEKGEKYCYITSLVAIDSDLSFNMSKYMPAGTFVNYAADITKLEYIERELYEKIVNLNTGNFIKTSAYFLSDCGITDNTWDLTEKRLQFAIDALRNKYKEKGEAFFEMPKSVAGVMPFYEGYYGGYFTNKLDLLVKKN